MNLRSHAVTTQHRTHRKSRHPTTITSFFGSKHSHAVYLQKHGLEPTLLTQALEARGAVPSGGFGKARLAQRAEFVRGDSSSSWTFVSKVYVGVAPYEVAAGKPSGPG